MSSLRFLAAIAVTGLMTAIAATTSSAAAAASGSSPTVAVTMHFEERINPSESDCPDIALGVNCGSGAVVPYGGAREEIAFGWIGCGGSCDFRQVDVAAGSIFSFDTAGDPVCIDAGCDVLQIPFTDTVFGGTGLFAGASGTLTGTVVLPATGFHGGSAHITISGTITLAS